MEIVSSLVDLLIILVAAKIGAELMSAIRQPPVIGELIMGMVVGASLLGWIDVQAGGIVPTLAELGVIILLFEVGLQIQMRDMLRLGSVAVSVALIGVVVPFAFGYYASLLFDLGGGSTEVALFLGAAMTATSVGITARVFSDFGGMETDEARTVIGAAVVDDIVGLLILAVVVALLGSDGSFATGDLLGLVLRVGVFLVVAVGVGALVMPYLLKLLSSLRVPGSYIVGALVIAIGVAVAAETLAGLDPIVGAFVAGLIVGQAEHVERIQSEIRPISHLLVPVFFVTIGAQINIQTLFEPGILIAGFVLSLLAAIGKVVAGLGVGRKPLRKLVVGVGMIPRGEVGLIFAGLGATTLSAVIGEPEVAIVVLMVILTTVLGPLLLSNLLRRPPPDSTLASPGSADVRSQDP
ncbi:MAG: cation:proton antiporter [Actinomycetota bacterium]|nr:cation:proton antiporter [Actinomycetota bacterium]